MTNETAVPIAAQFDGIPPNEARTYGAALVRSRTASVEDVNRHLTSLNVTPLNGGSSELIEAELSRLTSDPVNAAKILAGDPELNAKMNTLTLRLAKNRTGGGLEDAPPSASDYNFHVASMPGELDSDKLEYADGLREIAAELRLSPITAKSFVDEHLAAIAREKNWMRPEQRQEWADKQIENLRAVLPNFESQLNEAALIIKRETGKQFDLIGLAKTHSAMAAMIILHHAQDLARKRG